MTSLTHAIRVVLPLQVENIIKIEIKTKNQRIIEEKKNLDIASIGEESINEY